MSEEFEIPEFLSNETVDVIHSRMMDNLPDDIDKSEGQFPFDFTKPTALEKSRFVEFNLVEVLKLVFPQFAYGTWLDYHAENRGMTRKSATPSTGTITVTGTVGTVIPIGTEFSTESRSDVSSVDFVTTEAATIPAGGEIDIDVECTEDGTVGNVAIGTVVICTDELSSSFTNITNSAAFTGGTEIESDDSLRERISEYNKSQNVSYVGSPSDYKRWAKSINGVGEATIISPIDTSGIVTIVLTDSNGAPASETLCTEVYNFIMRPDNEAARLAPINASLVVTAPSTVSIAITATVTLASGLTIDTVESTFYNNLKEYLITASDEGEVKYAKIGSILLDTDGILDYSSLLVNNDTDNVIIDADELATTTLNDITFTEA